MITLIKLIVLLIVANGAPILARRIMGSKYNFPVDGDHLWSDNKPLFGPAKTWRGIVSSLVLASVAAVILALPWSTGLILAAGAMTGDLISSFIKRRLDIAPHEMALGLDQVPESLLPLLLVSFLMPLSLAEIAGLTIAFFVIELLLSKVLYRLKIRNRPY